MLVIPTNGRAGVDLSPTSSYTVPSTRDFVVRLSGGVSISMNPAFTGTANWISSKADRNRVGPRMVLLVFVVLLVVVVVCVSVEEERKECQDLSMVVRIAAASLFFVCVWMRECVPSSVFPGCLS